MTTATLTDRLKALAVEEIESQRAYLDDPARMVKKLTLEFFKSGPKLSVRAAPESERECGR